MQELEVVLSYMTGRRLTPKDIQTALDMPKATYYSQRDDNRLTLPANLIPLARHFGVNPVALLVEYGHLTPTEALRYRRKARPPEATMPAPAVHDRSSERPPKKRAVTDAGPDQIVVDLPANLGTTPLSTTNVADVIRQAIVDALKELTAGPETP